MNTIDVYINENLVQSPFAGGIGYSYPTFADIDDDGDPDLFIGKSTGHIQFFRNHSLGDSLRFELVDKEFLFIDAGDFSAPVFADIDNDGDQDLFIGNDAGGINFLINAGTAKAYAFALQTKNYVSFSGMNTALCFADIDGDIDLDLFIGEMEGNINFYLNVGTPENPQFALQTEQFAGIKVEGNSVPIFANIDNDGDFDLFVGRSNGDIAFFENDGSSTNPSFREQSANLGLSDFGSHSAPTFVDIDSDGDLDLFVGEKFGNINFVLNSGTDREPNLDLLFENFTTLDFGRASAPVFADIDNDADYDLFVGESDGEIHFFRNTGTTTRPVFALVTNNLLQKDFSDNTFPTFADIDNDGDLDLFVGKKIGNIHFFRNNGSNGAHNFILELDSLVAVLGRNSYPAFVDIDADSDLDLFVGNELGTIAFFRNRGNSTTPAFDLENENFASIDVGSDSSPTFVDIDQDGDLDLIVGENNGGVNFFRNLGTPNQPFFSQKPESFIDIDFGGDSSPAFVDIDGDGDLDLFAGEEDGGIYFFLNETIYTGVKELFPDRNGIPENFGLEQNFPNPFNPETTIRYRLPENAHTRLVIYNAIGQIVATLIDRYQHAGYYALNWDGKNDQGRELSSGIYFYRLEAGSLAEVRKLMLMR